jgi:hypothetical protein
VPIFGLGIRPFGPRTFPSLPTRGIISGVAIHLSKSISPEETFSTKSSEPTISAPESSAYLALSPFANTATRKKVPIPLGRLITPRTFDQRK